MSASVFRTDVNIRSSNTQSLLDRPANTKGLTSAEYLDQAAESANKQIDTDIKAMLDGFEALVGLSRIKDKDKLRIAQESFELEARADVMVRAAQSLTLLSHSLKLSLLLIQEPEEIPGKGITALDEEAIQLMKSTAREKERCARLLEEMFGLKAESANGPKSASKGSGPEANGATESLKEEVTEAKGQAQEPDDEDLEMSLVE